MTKTLEYILQKFNISYPEEIDGAGAKVKSIRMPVEIPNFGREQLANLFNELGYKIGVEVGVRDGGYSELLCKTIPGLKLYGVDPYEPHKGYRDHVKRSTFQAFEKEAHDKLDKFPNYTFMRMYSDQAVNSFADESLDFIYIDGDHDFFHVTEDITKWLPKIRKGGIISGDDYFKHKGNARIHVYQVVNGFTDAWHIRPWFVLGSKAIIEGEVRDHGRSWMWVKE